MTDKGWTTVRLVLGIVSIVIAAASFLFEVCLGLVAAFVPWGGTSESSRLFVPLMFLTAGILAILRKKSRTGAFVCAGLFGVIFVVSVIMYCRSGSEGRQLFPIYGVISLVLGCAFLVSNCRTWKQVLIPAAAVLVLIGLRFMILRVHQHLEERRQQEEAAYEREQEIAWEKAEQLFESRSPEETALDHMRYNSGISEAELVRLLELKDKMERDTAQQAADSLQIDWKKQALISATRMYAARAGVLYIGADDVLPSDSKVECSDGEETARQKIRKNLSDRGFSEDEISYALRNLENKTDTKDSTGQEKSEGGADADAMDSYFKAYLGTYWRYEEYLRYYDDSFREDSQE